MLTAEQLLAGAAITYEAAIPPEIQDPSGEGGGVAEGGSVNLRPLTVHDLQLVSRAAKENDELTATLMVQRALVEPELSVAQVSTMHVGLVQFLLGKVNEISGISGGASDLADAAAAPLAKAAFVLAQQYGWTPEEVNELTLGQVRLHLSMLEEQGA